MKKKIKKVVKSTKPKREAAVKVYVVPSKTRASKAIKSLKWKLPENRTLGKCCKVGCSKTGVQGIFCKKHSKILRKEQLRLNNIPWRKKVQAQGKDYMPDHPHLAYNGVATKFAVVKPKAALKLVKSGDRVLKTRRELEAAIAARNTARKAARKEKAPKAKVKKEAKPAAKVISIKKHKKEKAEKVKAKAPKKKLEFDFTA